MCTQQDEKNRTNRTNQENSQLVANPPMDTSRIIAAVGAYRDNVGIFEGEERVITED